MSVVHALSSLMAQAQAALPFPAFLIIVFALLAFAAACVLVVRGEIHHLIDDGTLLSRHNLPDGRK